MKILQVVHAFPPYSRTGTETLVYNLSKELAKTHEVYVFYGIHQRLFGIKKFQLSSFKREGVVVYELKLYPIARIWNIFPSGLYLMSCKNVLVENVFEKLVSSIRPNIVHFQHLIGLSLRLPFVAKKYCPIVLNLNDYWLLCPTTHFLTTNGEICKGPSFEKCSRCLSGAWSRRKLKVFGKLLEKRLRHAIKERNLYVRRLISVADKIITPSTTIVKKFVESGYISNEHIERGKVIILPHGVDVDNLSTVEKRPSSRIRFGYVGGLSERKGVHILVDAFNKIKDQDCQHVELRIYGKFDPADAYCKLLLEKSRGNPNIKFMGSFNDVKEPYSNIDVLVVPSITYEGYGLVVHEAFATRTPVIASDIGALNEFVKHMQNGLLFRVGDINDLASKMQMIIKNPRLISELRRNIGPVRSIREHVKDLEKIYEELYNRYKIQRGY